MTWAIKVVLWDVVGTKIVPQAAAMGNTLMYNSQCIFNDVVVVKLFDRRHLAFDWLHLFFYYNYFHKKSAKMKCVVITITQKVTIALEVKEVT